MSKEAIKMADVFEMPMQVEEGHGVDSDQLAFFKQKRYMDDVNTKQKAQAIQHAINTHDALVLQVANSKEAAIEMLSDFAELLLSARNAPNEAARLACLESSFKLFTREAEKARAALSKEQG